MRHIQLDFADDSELNKELLALMEPEPKPKSNAQPPKKAPPKNEGEIIRQMEKNIAEEPAENDETDKFNFDFTIPSTGGSKGAYPTLNLTETPSVIPKINFQASNESESEEEAKIQTESEPIDLYQPEPTIDASIPINAENPPFSTHSAPVKSTSSYPSFFAEAEIAHESVSIQNNPTVQTDLLSSHPLPVQLPSVSQTATSFQTAPSPVPVPSQAAAPVNAAAHSEPIKIEVQEDDVALEFELLDAKMPIGNFTLIETCKKYHESCMKIVFFFRDRQMKPEALQWFRAAKLFETSKAAIEAGQVAGIF